MYGSPLLVQMWSKVLAVAVKEFRLGDLPYRPGDPMFVCANTGRLKAATAWEPHFTLESGLQDTIEWWQQHLEQHA